MHHKTKLAITNLPFLYSICASWPKWAPWRAPLLAATVNRWPDSEAGHRGARCGKRVYYGGPPYLPAAGNHYLPRRAV